MQKPLIITLKLDDKAKLYFNELREEHFPAHINFLEAHLTLFHALPPGEAIVQNTLEQFSKRGFIELSVTGLEKIGNGVVYTVASDELQALHAGMQDAFRSFLVGKDKQKLWPHITIQNKVTAFKAQSLFEKLSIGFTPYNIKAIGFSTFLYNDGPWQHLQDYLFE